MFNTKRIEELEEAFIKQNKTLEELREMIKLLVRFNFGDGVTYQEPRLETTYEGRNVQVEMIPARFVKITKGGDTTEVIYPKPIWDVTVIGGNTQTLTNKKLKKVAKKKK